MKKLWIVLMVLPLLYANAYAQEKFVPHTFQSAAAATGDGVALAVDRYTTVGLQVVITNTATVAFEVTADGSNWVAAACVTAGSTTGIPVNTVTASGAFQCNIAGMQSFRARVSAFTSGTVTVFGRATTAVFGRSGGGLPAPGAEGDCLLTSSGLWGAGACPGAGTGAPTTSPYITTTPDATLSAEFALSSLATGILKNTTGTGVPSIAVAGTDYVAPAGNVATATALAANGANCTAGSGAGGTSAAGVAEDCTDYMEEPGSNGLVAKTAANTAAARTITGTANQITITNGDGVAGNPTAALSSTLVIPGPQIEFTEAAGDGTCAAGNFYIRANSTTNTFRKCQNGSMSELDTGGGGGSAAGGVNAVQGSNGSGTFTDTGCTGVSGVMTCAGGFQSTGGGTGKFTLLEGTAPGAGANAGEHNCYVDSSDSKFKCHENGGTVQTFVRTSDTLAVLNTSTSADLASVLNDETGSGGGFVRATSPTLVTPSFTGSPTLADGATWTFNPNATSSGFNYGGIAGDPSAPNNGDCWYNSTTSKIRCRENGVTLDAISTGVGSGDVTDVNPGAGIAVATPGGPAPTVSWDPSTFVNNITLWDSANASRTITAGLSGATDPAITFSNNLVNVSTGALQVGGVAVATADSTTTFTNKTYDAEGTGNSFTFKRYKYIAAAGCNNATAGTIWDLPTTSAAVPACRTGTNTTKGVLEFADGSSLSAQYNEYLNEDWTGAIDATIIWESTSTLTTSVVWQLAIACAGDGESDDPAFTDDVFTADANKATANQYNATAANTITTTGTCAAGKMMHVRLKRDSGHASDDFAGTARAVGVSLKMREAQ